MDTIDLEKILDDNLFIEVRDYRNKKYEYTTFIKSLIDNTNMTYTTFFKLMGFDYTNYHKKLNGRDNRFFTRDELIKIFLYFNVDLIDVQRYFKNNKYPILYVKEKRDLVLYMAFSKNMSLEETNKMLLKYKLEIV